MPITTMSVPEAFDALQSVWIDYQAVCRYTAFSRWYKGEHGRGFTAVRRAAKALVNAAKVHKDSRGKRLLEAVKSFHDAVASKSGAHLSDVRSAIDTWMMPHGGGKRRRMPHAPSHLSALVSDINRLTK